MSSASSSPSPLSSDEEESEAVSRLEGKCDNLFKEKILESIK
jgi:hypothetical protein